MGILMSNGMQAAMATAYTAANNTTAVTNAANAVFSQTGGHGYVVGDFVEVTSPGWPLIDGRIARVSVVATNDITLEGIDTSSTALFPAGDAATGGSLRKISTWLSLAQLTEPEASGDEEEYFTYKFLNELRQRSVPIGKTPLIIRFQFLDDPTHSQIAALKTAQALGQRRAFRFIYRGGTGATPPRTVFNAFPSVGSMGLPQANAANIRRFAVAIDADPTEYGT